MRRWPAAPDDAGPLTRPPGASVPGPHGGTDRGGESLLMPPRTGGSGLAGLAERVRSLGGELVAGSVETARVPAARRSTARTARVTALVPRSRALQTRMVG